MHIAECQWKFSFNFIKGVGRMDGEALERGWANLNSVASSTKEMGPGHRRNTLDDIIGDSNWKKLIGLGESLMRKLIEAVPEKNEHQEDLNMEAWENDISQPNPFEVKSESITQANIRHQLAKDEADEAAKALTPPIHTDVSPSILISAGMDLEEQQRRLRVETESLGVHATNLQKAKVQLHANALTRWIGAWTTVQTLYIPGVASLRAQVALASNTAQPEKPQETNLWMPSTIARQVPCDVKLEEIEWKLRIGQAHDVLNELRQALRSRSYMLCFKDRFYRGQGANTRCRNSLKAVDAKVDASAAKYHAAHGALLILSSLLGKVGWKNVLRPLQVDDIRSMTESSDPSEGRRWLSWIWIVCGYSESNSDDNGDMELQDAIHIEWCKSYARANQWAEEVQLLMEEQRRVLEFLHWQSEWWLDRQSLIATDDPLLEEGLKAYAQ